jgi:hypothetical protein
MNFIFFILLGISHAQMTMSPENCFEEKKFPCAVRTQKKVTLAQGGIGYYFSPGSLVEFLSKNQIHLVRGHVWVKATKNLKINTMYGTFETSDDSSEFWIDTEKDGYLLKVFSSHIMVTPKGLKNSARVEKGQQVFLSTIDYRNSSCFMSNPSAIDLPAHVRVSGKVFPFGQLSVDDHMNAVAGAILSASSKESLFLRANVSRQLASSIERDRRQKLEEIENRRLQDYLKRLFKVKSNFEDQ